MSWLRNFVVYPQRNTNTFRDIFSQKQLRVFWSASADKDFRPISYMYPDYQRFHNRNKGVPDLFVFSCLPYKGLYGMSIHEGSILYRDAKTKISCVSALRLDLAPSISYEINPNHYRLQTLDCRRCVLAKVRLESTEGRPYKTYILFLHMENINCFDALLSKKEFSLKYICAIQEGLGFGGCRKSIVSHLFEDGHVRRLSGGLEYAVIWHDVTHMTFQRHIHGHYGFVGLCDHYLEARDSTKHHFFVYRLGMPLFSK